MGNFAKASVKAKTWHTLSGLECKALVVSSIIRFDNPFFKSVILNKASMNLTGLWKGSFRYGKGYPSFFIGKSEPFQLNIVDNEGILSGFCIDKIVTAFPGNESTIEGIFNGNYISFIKKYKYQAVIDESNNTVLADDTIKNDGIHYVGHSYKRFFGGKIYFEGEWQLTTEYIEGNEKFYHSLEGTWTMSKL